MLFKKLLIVALGLTAVGVNAQTIKELTDASLKVCQAHDTERYLLFGPGDVVARDITKNASLRQVDWYDGPVRDACVTVDSFMAAHCHQEDNVFSGFPSPPEYADTGGDYSHAFELTTRCATWALERGKEVPRIHFAVVDVPKERMVFFGLSDAWHDRAIELAQIEIENDRALEKMRTGYNINFSATVNSLRKSIQDLNQQRADAFKQSATEYNNVFIEYFHGKCSLLEETLVCDEGFSVEQFAEESYQAGSSFELEPFDTLGQSSAMLVRVGEEEVDTRSEFEADLSLYPHVTRVMDLEHYQALVQAPVAIMLHCGFDGLDQDGCEYMLRDTKSLVQQCSAGSVVGFVDVTAMPELVSTNRFTGEKFNQAIKIYTGGQRTLFSFRNAMSLSMMGRIICG